MKAKIMTLCTIIGMTFCMQQTANAARLISVTVKCPVQIFDPKIAPPASSLPDYYFAYAKDKNRTTACSKAERLVKPQFPRGTKPKHCRCYDSK